MKVLRDAASQLSAVPEDINQLYYFATPPIFAQHLRYVLAGKVPRIPLGLCRRVPRCMPFVRMRSRAPRLAAFYPSSVAVEEVPSGLAEYAKAKAEGEKLCAAMMAQIAGLKVVIGRLPRVLTDQTATIAQVENADPLTVMLPFIHRLQEPT